MSTCTVTFDASVPPVTAFKCATSVAALAECDVAVEVDGLTATLHPGDDPVAKFKEAAQREIARLRREENSVPKVDSGVPIPRIARPERGTKYPYPDMEVGDSIFLEKDIKAATQTIAKAKKLTGFKFTARTVEGGTRVWRIE